MATIKEQIENAFQTNISAGKTPQQIYDAMKSRLAGNTTAMTMLDSHYKDITSGAAQPNINQPQTSVTTIPQPIVKPVTTPTTYTTTQEKPKTASVSVPKTITPVKQTVQEKFQDVFDRAIKQGKTAKDAYEAIRSKLPSGSELFPQLVNFYNQYGVKQPDKKMQESRDTQISNQIGATINTSGLDKDTAAQVHNEVNAINNEFNDKINTQQAYAKGVMDSYNQYGDELKAKYGEIGKKIEEQEKEMLDNYGQLKKAVADNYASGLESYARNAAAAQAGVTETLSKSGISGAALSNALAEAQYDPKRLAAIQSLKDKQISDLTNLQQNYANWSNAILQNKSTLTTAEKELADKILTRKDQLDAELNNLKNTNIEEAYKPLKTILGEKTTALAVGEKINVQQNKMLNDYLSATPARKKDILMYQLQQDKVDTGFIDESLLAEALKRKDLPDALAFLSSKAKERMTAQQKDILTYQRQQDKADTGLIDEAFSKLQDTVSKRIASGDDPKAVKDALIKGGKVPMDMINKLNFGARTGTTTGPSNEGKNTTPNTKKNVQSDKSMAASIAKGVAAGGAAYLLQNKITGSQLVKSGVENVNKLKDYVIKKIGINSPELSRIVSSNIDSIVNNPNKTITEVIQESDDMARKQIAKEMLTKASSSSILDATEKTVAKRMAESLITNGWGVLKTGGKILGKLAIPIAIGMEVADYDTAGAGNQFNKREDYINNLLRNGVSQAEANAMADKEASYGSFNQ